MPHFIIECSENVLRMKTADEIMNAVYDEAMKTSLFAKNDIKVRIQAYSIYKLGEEKDNFLHVFAHIMQGRTTEQKANLSRKVTERLNTVLPQLSILSMNVIDFDLASYCNKSIINPNNSSGDRHFGL
jgi:5-carboxymethyl-2-hydroxymuconate isomerase